MPPRMAPRAAASLPDSNHRRAEFGFGGASCLLKSMLAAAPNPTLIPARLASMAAGPLSARRFSIGANTCSICKAEQAARDAERDHVGASVGDGLGHLLHRNFDDACAGFKDHRRRLAAARVADHQRLRAGLDLGAETVGVQPVDADKYVEFVGQTFDRMNGQAKQPCRLAAANLGAQGAGK